MKIYSAQLKGTTTVATGSNVSLTGSFSGSIAGIDINANNTFTSSTNQFTASISETNTFTSSTSAKLNSIETITASNIARLDLLEVVSGSNINRLNALENKTGSLASTGSNTFYGTQIISGTTWIAGDFIVQGSSSIQYISASSVSIGTNIVNLNTANPAVRYAGISVQDSGSANGVTGSMLWDSTCNRWIYSNPSGVGYSGGIIMSGPRAATFGTETTLTCNYIAKSGGGDHLYDSCISELSGSTCVFGSLTTTGNNCVGGMSTFASCVGIGTSNICNVFAVQTSTGYFSTRDNGDGLLFATYDCTKSIGLSSGINYSGGANLSWIKLVGGTSRTMAFAVGDEFLRINSDGVSCFTNSIVLGSTNGTTNNTLRIYRGSGASNYSELTNVGGTTYIRANGITGVAANLELQTKQDDWASFCSRLTIIGTGIACFSCQVCVPYLSVKNSDNSILARFSGAGDYAIFAAGANAPDYQATDMNAVLNLGTRCGGTAFWSLATKGGAAFALSGGCVAIGTQNPAASLHVVGTGTQFKISYSTYNDPRYMNITHGGILAVSGDSNNWFGIEMCGGNTGTNPWGGGITFTTDCGLRGYFAKTGGLHILNGGTSSITSPAYTYCANEQYREVVYAGYASGTDTIAVRFCFTNQQAPWELTAISNHYGLAQGYGAIRKTLGAVGPNSQYIDLVNSTSANGGCWLIYPEVSGVIVCKSAGTYGGAGYWFVKMGGTYVCKTSV